MQAKTGSAQETVFQDLPIPSALRKMIIPAVTSQLIVLIYNMADTFFVGQTNNPYMVAATSLILPVFNITLCLAGLAGIGGGSLISRLLGQGRPDEARRVSAFSLWLGLCIAALFAAGIGLFMDPVLRLLGAGENTYAYARQYALCVIVVGGIPTVLSNVLSNLIRSIGRSKAASAGIILGGVLNIALDPLFMFVLLPEGHEVLGAGLATCLSNCIAFLFFVSVLLRMGKNSTITFLPKGGLPGWDSILAVFGVGIPSAIATFLFDLDYVIIDKLMVSYHDLALAAIGIVLKVERFPLNVGIGICQGMLPLVAYNYSAGNEQRMNDTIRLSCRLGLTIAGISIVLYEIFAVQFSHLFISDPQTVELASQFLRIRVLATPLMFLSFFTVYLFQAFGKGRISLFLGVTRWLGFNIPMLFLLNALFGMFGIVWSQVTADILTVLLSFYVYRRYKPSAQKSAPLTPPCATP
ncbi:MATE family efflux transporter [Flavonifractor sp. AGMB03687]|uniref:MATE family efflux transporter n=1 Tax=Flavonifractor sp. AGMB03687 TaxID=2785133 RepID=UPI001FD82AEB|nr:MATE family efflux transporter [Flavonifractor sp. AGMB03687]